MLREVTKLRSLPPLTDIAGRLRSMADDIEAGKIQPRYVVVVAQQHELGAQAYHFGESITTHEVAGVLLRCANRIVR